jgi:FMN phosphatase YigB (HAD superfamily)
MKLFLDLDGVLADFDAGVEQLTGKRPDQQSTRDMWRALAKAPDFFGTLAMMQDAHLLWAWCKPFRPTILTGLPFGTWAPAQKKRWVANMLGADVEVITCMSRDKHRWSGPGHVLVDDREKTRESWEAAGGTFILHRSAKASIDALRRLGFEVAA